MDELTEREHETVQGLIISALMYRLGISEIKIEEDDILAAIDMFGGKVMDLRIKIDHRAKTINAKIVKSESTHG